MSKVTKINIPDKEKEKKEKIIKRNNSEDRDKEEGVTVEALLDSRATELVMSLEFVRKKKLKRLIYVRNVNSTFNHEGLIEYTVEVELFYKEHKERTEIDIIGGQK